MKHLIDLHGIKHNEALIKVEDALLKASIENGMEFEIITGNRNSERSKKSFFF